MLIYFFNFFKDLNSAQEDRTNTTLNTDSTRNEEMDRPITDIEIVTCINKLKNNKAAGMDNICNEFIKNSYSSMIKIYVLLFNLVFSTGVFPDSWKIGVIKPIFKNKGSKHDPDNYRPITILSCLGKLFTAVLNARLYTFVNMNNIIGEEQLGFRKNYSTIDGAFILYAMTNIMKFKRKSTFAAFIDLKKCFPSISRPLLFAKLSNMNVGTKMLTIIISMYNDIKSCVSYNGKCSDMFSCQVGLREGEILSPIMFSLYVNDLYDYLHARVGNGILIDYDIDEITNYFNMFLLMYADDTVLFAESKAKLQELLRYYEQYCNDWDLKINVDKTKIMVFGRSYRKPKVFLNQKEVEIVTRFKYLGVTFSKNGRFINAIKDNIDKATRATYLLIRRCRQELIPPECQIELFSKCIEPILLYGSELWGYENSAILEKFRLKYFKIILKAKLSTPAYMIYGELGKVPLKCDIEKRMVSYWGNLITSIERKYSHTLYKILLNFHMTQNNTTSWMAHIVQLFQNAGFAYMWENQNNIIQFTSTKINRRILDQYIQNCRSSCGESNKGRNYIILKETWEQESYMSLLDPIDALYLFKLRTANHRLPVETGRFRDIEYKDRLCHICRSDIGDEYHYILSCPKFETERMKYLPKNYYKNPSMIKYKTLVQNKNPKLLKRLCKLIKVVINSVKT